MLPFDPARLHRHPNFLAIGTASCANLRPIVSVGERGRLLNFRRRVLSQMRAIKPRLLNLGPHLRGGGCACMEAQIVAKTGLHSARLRSRSALARIREHARLLLRRIVVRPFGASYGQHGTVQIAEETEGDHRRQNQRTDRQKPKRRLFFGWRVSGQSFATP